MKASVTRRVSDGLPLHTATVGLFAPRSYSVFRGFVEAQRRQNNAAQPSVVVDHDLKDVTA